MQSSSAAPSHNQSRFRSNGDIENVELDTLPSFHCEAGGQINRWSLSVLFGGINLADFGSRD